MGVEQTLARFSEPIYLPWVTREQAGFADVAGGGAPPATVALRQQIELLLDGAEAGVCGVDRDGRATVVTPSVSAMT